MLTQLNNLLGLTQKTDLTSAKGDSEAAIDFGQVFANLENEMDNAAADVFTSKDSDATSEPDENKENIDELDIDDIASSTLEDNELSELDKAEVNSLVLDSEKDIGRPLMGVSFDFNPGQTVIHASDSTSEQKVLSTTSDPKENHRILSVGGQERAYSNFPAVPTSKVDISRVEAAPSSGVTLVEKGVLIVPEAEGADKPLENDFQPNVETGVETAVSNRIKREVPMASALPIFTNSSYPLSDKVTPPNKDQIGAILELPAATRPSSRTLEPKRDLLSLPIEREKGPTDRTFIPSIIPRPDQAPAVEEARNSFVEDLNETGRLNETTIEQRRPLVGEGQKFNIDRHIQIEEGSSPFEKGLSQLQTKEGAYVEVVRPDGVQSISERPVPEVPQIFTPNSPEVARAKAGLKPSSKEQFGVQIEPSPKGEFIQKPDETKGTFESLQVELPKASTQSGKLVSVAEPPSQTLPVMARVNYPFLVGSEDELEGLELTLTSSSGEIRQSVGSAITPTPSQPPRIDASQLMRQVSDGIQKMSEGGVELRLSPEELGPVRMQFVQTEQGLNIHIVADRSETLDLIRRHIDQLAKDLADSGFGSAGFTFGDDGSQAGQKQYGASNKNNAIDEQAPTDQPASVVHDGLDVRM